MKVKTLLRELKFPILLAIACSVFNFIEALIENPADITSKDIFALKDLAYVILTTLLLRYLSDKQTS